jgi:deoxyhypusine synthase
MPTTLAHFLYCSLIRLMFGTSRFHRRIGGSFPAGIADRTALSGMTMHPHKPHYERRPGDSSSREYLQRISRQRIDPPPVTPELSPADLIDATFVSYNAGRLREGCQLFVRKMLANEGTVGLALSGALTPAGLGISCLVPLVEAGFIDWIVSTGANLYHDTHYALGMELHQAGPHLPDYELREHQLIRIYDIVFDYENLLGTDAFFRTLCRGPAFQRTFSTAEFHYLVGMYLQEREQQTGRGGKNLLAACYRCGVPVFTSSPGDSSIGMNLAALQLEGSQLQLDPLRDVNQTAAIVWDAKSSGKNQFGVDPRRGQSQKLHAANGAADSGSARPDRSGTRLFPAVHRCPTGHRRPLRCHTQRGDDLGKVDPDKLPDSVTCYVDSTIALPLLTAYALSRHPVGPTNASSTASRS